MVYDSKTYKDVLNVVANELPDATLSFLITGATGLIGSCMIDVLMYANQEMNRKYHIYALGRNLERLEKRFSYAADSLDIEFVVQDVADPIMLNTGVDYVIHAASNADPVSYAKYPAETLLTNICGTRNVLEYSRMYADTKVLLTSTFEVYGKNQFSDEYAEDTEGIIDLNALRSCYPESKRCAEILMRCYHDEYDIFGMIARLCSIYGPTMLPGDSKAHAQFIRKALAGEEIILKSAGKQERTYCYVMDAVSALFTVLFKGKKGEAYNIANEESIASIAQVAGELAEISGTAVKYDIPNEIEKKGFSKPQNCILLNQKLKALGWKGKYTLREGLVETLQILKEIKE